MFVIQGTLIRLSLPLRLIPIVIYLLLIKKMMGLLVKVASFGRATLSYPLTLTSPGLPGETISLPECVQPTYGAQEYQNDTDTALSGYQSTPWSSGALEIHFLCPERFTLGQCMIRTRDQ